MGDLDIETWQINDESLTDNGDVYRIFNTVLSTIPLFFEKYPNAGVMVRGSDGQAEYEDKCKQNCARNCIESCHNFNRRMKLYCSYASRKHSLFETDYQFLGGMGNDQNWFDFIGFMPGELYDSIIVSRKMFKFEI